MSEAVTRGIRVRVRAAYLPERSAPHEGNYFFAYRITISNEGSETAQLIARHWVITDAEEHVEEVRGEGVVGEQPVLRPGESFEYTSFCPLSTPFGTMQGTYLMLSASGEHFQAEIAPFTLAVPHTVN